MLSLRNVGGIPSTKVSIGIASFVSYIVPPVVCYIGMAILAVTPKTRAARVTLWPIVALLAMRAAVSVDLTFGDPEKNFINYTLVFLMMSIAVHSLSWTSAKKPLVRYHHPGNSSPSILMDALDLATNLRGLGWEWSRGLYIPHETRPMDRRAFVFHALRSAVMHAFINDLLQQAIKTFITTPHGYTIFDDTLPLSVQYFRASIITILIGAATQSGIQAGYSQLTVVAVLVCGQDPAQWPPMFNNPWGATSINDFWSRRWHQLYRNTFLLGAYPFSVSFGRVGTIIGAFLTSGYLHYLMLIPLDSRSGMWQMLVGFGMMAPGALAERAFYKSTGKKVGGVAGWVWTMTWMLLWGTVIADGFSRAGMLTFPCFPAGGQLPVRAWVTRLVVYFDAWLHTN